MDYYVMLDGNRYEFATPDEGRNFLENFCYDIDESRFDYNFVW